MGGIIGGLFSKPKPPPPPPGPDPEMLKAQREQEARIEAREQQSQREIAARKRARRSGGNRALLAQRENPFLGVPSQTTLGPAPFSRSGAGSTG
tara:strand:- start:1896 stop:2177 length:282 start_codon:yes stop_codon:yes gene_type:complete